MKFYSINRFYMLIVENIINTKSIKKTLTSFIIPPPRKEKKINILSRIFSIPTHMSIF